MDRGQLAAAVAALLLAAPMLLPCLTPISPRIYFDVDPRSEVGRTPIASLGPAGAAWLHVISVACAAAAMAIGVRLGGPVRWGACALFALGAAAAMAHLLTGPLDDRVQCGAWIAAAAVGLATAHLAQHELARRWLVAMAIAALLPMAIQAAWYVLVEHPATVAMYRRMETQMLQARGWTAGSPQHEIFSRRLTDAAALGAFGLSNVFGSMVAALTLLAGAAAVGLRLVWSRRRAYRLPATMAAAGAGTLLLTQSKGAMLAAAAGAGLLTLIVLSNRQPGLRRWLPAVALALVAAAAGAVVVRGSLGPPDTWRGERSLLFRWHYWQGAARTLVEDAPASLVAGVGPGGFQSGYLRHKPAISPEEVASAHNVFVDLVVMLGVGGGAWSLLLLGWLGMGAKAAATMDLRGSPDPPGPSSHALVPAAVLAAVLFVVQLAVQFPAMLTAERLLIWLIGLVGFVAIGAGVHGRLAGAPNWTHIAAVVAAAAVLCHNQIEMAFHHLASATPMWALVALAAGPGAGDGSKQAPRRRAMAPAVALLALALALAAVYAAPLRSQQAHLAGAAQSLRQQRIGDALSELDAAAAGMPDAQTLHWRVQLNLDLAYGLAHRGQATAAAGALDRARAAIRHGQARGLAGPGPFRLLASVEQAAAQLLSQPDRLDAAADALEQAIARGPYSLPDHLRLGDLLWSMDRRSGAAEAYRQALRISEWNYLDPARQLTRSQRQRIDQRLAEQTMNGSSPR